MPSGAKKRKAAKKKMEIHHNPSSSSSTPTHADGDGDGKESEVSSPASLDRRSPRSAFSGGEDETERQSNVPVVDEPRDVVVEDTYQKDGKLEHQGGSSRGSSVTSSDDEISFEEMKYRRAGNAPRDELPEGVSLSGEKTAVDVSSQENNNGSCVAHSVEEGSKRKEIEEKPIIPRVEDVSVISDTTDECLCVSNNIPIASGDDHERDSEVSEPLLVSAPRPEQTTSWKGCCGLFEVFTGSGR